MGKRKLSETIGLTRETAEQLLEELFTMRTTLEKKYDELKAEQGAQQGIRVESLGMTALRQQLEKTDERVAQIRDWYGLQMLETIEEESRRLKWLTLVLVALTAVLAIFTGFLVSGIRLP